MLPALAREPECRPRPARPCSAAHRGGGGPADRHAAADCGRGSTPRMTFWRASSGNVGQRAPMQREARRRDLRQRLRFRLLGLRRFEHLERSSRAAFVECVQSRKFRRRSTFGGGARRSTSPKSDISAVGSRTTPSASMRCGALCGEWDARPRCRPLVVVRHSGWAAQPAGRNRRPRHPHPRPRSGKNSASRSRQPTPGAAIFPLDRQ